MGWPGTRRLYRLGTILLLLAVPLTGHAQIDSREGIALQNQLYQLRQEIQSLRGEYGRGGGGGGGGDIAAQLLSRVQSMEEQLRQLRGRIDETQNLVNRQNADLAKRIEDLTFQFNLQSRGGAAAPMAAPPPIREPAARPMPESLRTPDPPPQARPDQTAQTRPDQPPRIVMPPPAVIPLPPPPPPQQRAPQTFTFNQTPEPMREGPAPAREPPPPPARVEPPAPPPAARTEPTKLDPPKPTARPVPAPEPKPALTDVAATVLPPGGRRTPEMALQEGHSALARRDYPAAERAAREVMMNRTSPRVYDGQFLLAQSLAGQKQFAQSAIAFDDAYNRSHKGRYAQDALLGLAGALTAINERKAACDTLSRLRTEFPQVRADLKDAITRTNERAGCGR